MTTIELIGLLSSSSNLAKILSKFFMPPEAINPEITMEYLADGGVLEYGAKFSIPKLQKFSLRKKISCVELDCGEGFLSIDGRLETETASRELIIPKLHCSVPALLGEKDFRSLRGKRVFMKIQISLDLSHRIRCEWNPQELVQGRDHLKAKITNTMDIRVRGYRVRRQLPTNRRLRRANLIINGTPQNAPLILLHRTEVHCANGNLEGEFPTVNTSNQNWFQVQGSDESSEIIVPIDSIQPSQEIVVDLLFG